MVKSVYDNYSIYSVHTPNGEQQMMTKEEPRITKRRGSTGNAIKQSNSGRRTVGDYEITDEIYEINDVIWSINTNTILMALCGSKIVLIIVMLCFVGNLLFDTDLQSYKVIMNDKDWLKMNAIKNTSPSEPTQTTPFDWENSTESKTPLWTSFMLSLSVATDIWSLSCRDGGKAYFPMFIAPSTHLATLIGYCCLLSKTFTGLRQIFFHVLISTLSFVAFILAIEYDRLECNKIKTWKFKANDTEMLDKLYDSHLVYMAFATAGVVVCTMSMYIGTRLAALEQLRLYGERAGRKAILTREANCLERAAVSLKKKIMRIVTKEYSSEEDCETEVDDELPTENKERKRVTFQISEE